MRASYTQISAQNRKQMRIRQLPHVGDLVHKSNPFLAYPHIRLHIILHI